MVGCAAAAGAAAAGAGAGAVTGFAPPAWRAALLLMHVLSFLAVHPLIVGWPLQAPMLLQQVGGSHCVLAGR